MKITLQVAVSGYDGETEAHVVTISSHPDRRDLVSVDIADSGFSHSHLVLNRAECCEVIDALTLVVGQMEDQ